jgi:cytochrome b561
MKPSRYHPALVALHWVSGALLVAALLLGTFVMKEIPNTSPQKLEALRAHMAGGIVILMLIIARLIVRLSTPKPERASAGTPFLDRLAPASHYGLYVLILLMATTGLATAFLAGLFDIVFAGSGAPLPVTFAVFPTRIAHGIIAKAIFALIGLHVLAALYHQFIRRDGLLGRMWFGKSRPASADREAA